MVLQKDSDMLRIVERSSLCKIKIIVSKYHIIFGKVRCIKICFIDANVFHIKKRAIFCITFLDSFILFI